MEQQGNNHIEHLAKLVQESIDTHRPKKNSVRTQSRNIRIFVILASALTTISLGLNFSDNSPWIDWSRNIALVFAALATAAATLNGLLDLDNYWLSKNVMLTSLERLSEKISYFIRTQRILSQQELDDLFYEYQSAMHLHIDYWKDASRDSLKTDAIADIPKVD